MVVLVEHKITQVNSRGTKMVAILLLQDLVLQQSHLLVVGKEQVSSSSQGQANNGRCMVVLAGGGAGISGTGNGTGGNGTSDVIPIKVMMGVMEIIVVRQNGGGGGAGAVDQMDQVLLEELEERFIIINNWFCGHKRWWRWSIRL